MGKWQSSAGYSVVAPLEEQYRWYKGVQYVTNAGEVVMSKGTPQDEQVVWGAFVPNKRLVRMSPGFGWVKASDGQIVIRGKPVEETGEVVYPDIETGDVLVDKAGQEWEVLRCEEWGFVGLLVLDVRRLKSTSSG